MLPDNIMTEMELEIARLQRIRAEEWCLKHKRYHTDNNGKVFDVNIAPNLVPNGVVCVSWGSGYLIMDADLFVKLPKNKLSLLQNTITYQVKGKVS